MAIIVPFRALRYDPSRVSISDVVTQPYDKITSQMQDRYYKASPYNLVRIILGKSDPGDSETENVYTRAASSLREWRKQGVFPQDPEPSVYVYTQRFRVPPSAGAGEYVRRGFIALGKIEDYDAGVVFRHEQTLAKPKADRLNLLRATRAHFGQIFMLYSDPGREVETMLETNRAPDIDITDEYGVVHQVWRVGTPSTLNLLSTRTRDKKLIIADGHHRYETALTYRSERRAMAARAVAAGQAADTEAGVTSGQPGQANFAPHDLVMMTFVNMDGDGVVILPTHRVVRGLPGFDAQTFAQKAAAYFEVEPIAGEFDVVRTTSVLRDAGSAGTAILAVTRSGAFMMRARPGAAQQLLTAYSPLQQQLDVLQLHKVLLEHVLGISEEAIRNQQFISYFRDAAEAIAQVRAGADVAFLMNPAQMLQLRDIAFAGQVLPQKSTDFYPKLLSGLTIYALE